jgi:hypothetical protein
MESRVSSARERCTEADKTGPVLGARADSLRGAEKVPRATRRGVSDDIDALGGEMATAEDSADPGKSISQPLEPIVPPLEREIGSPSQPSGQPDG